MLFVGFLSDVLFVDSAQKVIGTRHALPPWGFGGLHLRCRFIIELPASSASTTGTQVGEQLQAQSCEAQEPSAPAQSPSRTRLDVLQTSVGHSGA